MKIVSVVGRKNTGKTSLTVKIIEELTRRGHNVASIKHSHHEMEMDREHTDTWRHKLAGSNVVVGIGSTSFFNVKDILDLNRLLFLIKFMDNIDFVVIEGFKSYNYPKIVTSLDVVDEYTIAEIDSFSITPEGVSDLVDLIEKKGHDIVDTLFLDECGFSDGDSIAKEIIKGNIKTNDLDKVDTFMSIDNKVIGLNEFVSDFIKKTLLGIIKTLHIEEYGVKNINKVELIINNEDNIDLNPKVEANVLINNKQISLNHHTNNFVANTVFGMINSLNTDETAKLAKINISEINQDNLEKSEVNLEVNNKNVEINTFVKGILKETIFGMIKSLKLGELDINEIKNIDITVKK
ncbi:molybdopterin-guanine dinucleotide biosynthesis protein B [uncultured Methanobrevibacter sp.]|uniref:molybdopterin-guanine dinucleotide biosynthesis protein B n=1 Tax=uncultured Methanobrevibacter sp. TaxID=253161 RepID=UPI00261D5F22|nr:molybdopterin-guanine dinucleotide biosynthesis protein B [uncultured Methanobrevibacter sp.]